MLTFSVLRDDGTPWGDATISVVPWWSPRAVAEGAHADATRATVPDSAALERVLLHVVDWSGVFYHGAPLPFGRSAARAVLRSSPSVLRQTIAAIDAVSQAGLN